MRFNAKYQPELCASTDETRVHLASAHLDTAKSVMVATNGHMLVKVPCKPEPGDIDGSITSAALKESRRMARKRRYTAKGDDRLPRVRARKKLLDAGDALHRRPTGHQFVPWEGVMPNFKPGDKGTVSFGVSPRYLLDVAQAMGCLGGYSPLVKITIKITPKMLDPLLVEPGHEGDRDPALIAIVMPGRV